MREPLVLESRSAEETLRIGERIGASLAPGAIILLCGDLGAGKTVLAKGIARALGVREEVSSPTYTLVSEYAGRLRLIHVDLYRIGQAEEIEGLGLDDLLWGDAVSLIEWGEKLRPLLEGGYAEVFLAIHPDSSRSIAIHGIELKDPSA
jgi:tRNA threonylcarbamoyladenosine biosynthesis protein TsaE